MFYGQTEKLQYLPMASAALLIGGLTLTSFTLQQGIIYLRVILEITFWSYDYSTMLTGQFQPTLGLVLVKKKRKNS